MTHSLNNYLLILTKLFRYKLILNCWHFKPDMRPSFSEINENLCIILEKYESKKLHLIKLKEMKDSFCLNETKDGNISKLKLGQTSFKNQQPEFVPSPILKSQAPHLNTPKLSINNLSDPKRGTSLSSKSEDSQYYSGPDSSLVYADSSNFSSSSEYSNYSVAPPKMMVTSSSTTPPSPPPIKSLSKLLNVASAAYNL